jgi:molybdopterin-guanine dinucleotide biosynthesis protein MobB
VDHDYQLEEEKDTTVFFDAGAEIAIGIDAHKSVAAIRKNTLDDALHLLVDQGMDFAIIEGFKQRSFPKIVIGDLTVDRCILTNPATDEVIASLNLFEDFNK